MAGSVNKVILVGNLGAKPDVRTMQSGGRVANLSVATSESWKDKNTGERKENTQWHRVVIFNDALVGVAERYLDKGSKVYIEGQLETRSWEQDGKKNYTTEVVLRPYRGELTMLDGASGGSSSAGSSYNQDSSAASFGGAPAQVENAPSPFGNDIDDEIPF